MAVYPQNRQCTLPGQLINLPTLRDHWQFSNNLLQQIIACLGSLQNFNPGIVTLAAAGSFGRMEAAPVSDLDLVIVVDNDVIGNHQRERACVEHVWQLLASTGIDKPLAEGIFMQPVSEHQLTDPRALGNLDYPRHVFGIRMQLLLDAQPVFNTPAYQQVIGSVLNWYCCNGTTHTLLSPGYYLINDLVRYFRSYAVWHQFDTRSTDTDSWHLRQLKLHHSRLVSYIALLLQIAGSQQDLPSHLQRALFKTPLERLYNSFLNSPNSGFTENEFVRLLTHYDHLLKQLCEPAVRDHLLRQPAPDLLDSNTCLSPLFLSMINDAGLIRNTLVKFWLDRQAISQPDILANILF